MVVEKPKRSTAAIWTWKRLLAVLAAGAFYGLIVYLFLNAVDVWLVLWLPMMFGAVSILTLPSQQRKRGRALTTLIFTVFLLVLAGSIFTGSIYGPTKDYVEDYLVQFVKCMTGSTLFFFIPGVVIALMLRPAFSDEPFFRTGKWKNDVDEI